MSSAHAIQRPKPWPQPQKLVDRLKRERFRAIFDYLRQGAPAPVLNLLEVVQVGLYLGRVSAVVVQVGCALLHL